MSFEEHAKAYTNSNSFNPYQLDDSERIVLRPIQKNILFTTGHHQNFFKDNMQTMSMTDSSTESSDHHTFPSAKKLKRHKCHQCQKAFDRPSTLKTHMNSHTGERPHSCTLCDARFSVRSNLKRHLRRCHSK
jgi:uncharacterized Zn-finger protein